MQILDNFIILSLPVIAFVMGMRVANKYNAKAASDRDRALQTQYLRLRANADADDPCKPYPPQQWEKPLKPVPINTGDYDGDNLNLDKAFEQRLKQNGKAVVKFNKADIAK